MSEVKLILGDCLEEMKKIPDGSIDLVLTDPPYGTVEVIGASETISHGMKGKTDWDVAIEPSLFWDECNRVLRMNGAILLFSQEPYTSRLITEAHSNLPFSYRLVWVKDHFANALGAKKAPVSFYEDIVVFFKKYDTMGLHPLRTYSLKVLEHCGGRMKTINSRLGHRRAEHFFYVESTQFGLCTKPTYDQLCEVYGIHHQTWFIPYKELEEINRRFNRRFNLPEGKKYISNVLEYKKDYSGFHPTQKPVALMEYLIKTYTNEGETVLDFTMGSGTTGVACKNLNRDFIGIELDTEYFKIANERINAAQRKEVI